MMEVQFLMVLTAQGILSNHLHHKHLNERMIKMIDFTLKPYEWQEEMEVLFSNSNLESIVFLSGSSLKFHFLNSFDGKKLGTLYCKEMRKLQYELDENSEFPIFIGDVRIHCLKQDEIEDAFEYLDYGFIVPTVQEYYLVCINSGEISVIVLCGKIDVEDDVLR